MAENRYLKWLSSETDSIYWHDSAIFAEQQEALENGAVGMTTNPFLIQSTLNSDRGFWEARLEGISKELKGTEKAEALMKCATGFYAENLRPIFDKGEIGKGFVCAQTNPLKTGDRDLMIEQARRYTAWAPNIVIKLPATNAGIQAYEACVAEGMNVAATVSFTVPQVLAVGEAAARGKEKARAKGIKPGLTIAVLMVGRLDDYLRDVAQDSEAAVSESDITQAGLACIKRAYSIFNERGYDTFLMPAGCRGANHITELAGAKMIMSIAPKIAKLLKDVDCFEKRIDIPIADDVIRRLMTMPEFCRAYEVDGMKPTEFIAYGASNRTTDQFINDGWNPLVNFKF